MSPVSVGSKRAHSFALTFTRCASTALNVREIPGIYGVVTHRFQDSSCPRSSPSEPLNSHLKNLKRALSALLRRAPSDESIEEFRHIRQLALTTDAIKSKRVHELLLQAAAHEHQPLVVTELFELAHQQ